MLACLCFSQALHSHITAWQTEFSDYTDLQKSIQRAAAFSEAAREDLCAFSAVLMDRYVRIPAAGIIPLPTQRERAEAYRHYMQKAAVHPCAVGAHYFAYNDQPLWGRYDCENFQFGFVDVCQMPYPQFTETAAEINKQIVSLRQNGKEE